MLSLSALKTYNSFYDVTIKVQELIEFRQNQQSSSATIPITVHNNLDYITLPIYHLSKLAIQKPTMASFFQSGMNDQYIHQKSITEA